MASEGYKNNGFEKARSASAGLLSDRMRHLLMLGIITVVTVAAAVSVVGAAGLILGFNEVTALGYPLLYTFIAASMAGAALVMSGK